MKSLLLSLLTLCFLFSVCVAQEAKQPSDWKEFVSTEGNFKVQIPNISKNLSKQIVAESTKNNPIRFDSKLSDLYFLVTYIDYSSPSKISDEQIQSTFENLVIGSLKQDIGSGELISEKVLLINGKQGREIIIKASDRIIKYRICVHNQRVFQYMASFSLALKGDSEAQQQVDKFLDSFQIIEK